MADAVANKNTEQDRHSSNAEALENHIFSLPADELEGAKGNPDKVLQLVHDYCEKRGRFMVVGGPKGDMVLAEMQKRQPNVMVELGCFVGYSALMFGGKMPRGGKYYSLEINPEFARISQRFLDLAGLQDTVEILVGPAAEGLAKVAQKHSKVDMAFIDHWKDVYLPDLRVMESLGLVQPGTFMAADNIISPGVPDYQKYVQSSQQERKEYNESTENVSGKQYVGNWKLQYRSETKKPYEGYRDGLELTECVGVGN